MRTLLLSLDQCNLPLAILSLEDWMRWKKPRVKEICVGLEINDYYPAEL